MDKRELAIELLTTKAKELDRLPKRADFSDSDVCFMKQKLGPWPRALEAAGLKEPPAVSRIDKNRAKRARAKARRKNEQRDAAPTKRSEETDSNPTEQS